MIEKMSYSALRNYLQCPLLYWYRSILKIKFPYKPVPLAFGSALHLALELKFKNKKTKPLKVFAENFLYKDLYFRPNVDFHKINYKENLENGKRLLTYFFENHSEHLNNIKSAEQRFKFFLKNPATKKSSKIVRCITGITDYVTKDEGIGDYKTSTKKYKQKDIDESLQPTFYYMWYYNTYGKLPKYFEYIVFLKKHKREPIQIMRTHRTVDDIISLYHLIEQQGKLINARKFPRAIHAKYDFCDCKLYDSVLKV